MVKRKKTLLGLLKDNKTPLEKALEEKKKPESPIEEELPIVQADVDGEVGSIYSIFYLGEEEYSPPTEQNPTGYEI